MYKRSPRPPAEGHSVVRPFVSATRMAITIALACLLPACGGIGESLKLDQSILVKVPQKQPNKDVITGANGWNFAHIVEAPKSGGRGGQWYLAWHNTRPIVGRGLFPNWNEIFRRAPEIAEDANTAFHCYPLLIEPNQTFGRVAAKQDEEPAMNFGEKAKTSRPPSTTLSVTHPPLRVWDDNRRFRSSRTSRDGFVINPFWHLDCEHSQLASARAELEKQGKKPGEGIVIGHLDNGLDGSHAGAPRNLVKRKDGSLNALGYLEFVQRQSRWKPGQTLIGPPVPPDEKGGTHGLGTIGILAGRKITIPKTNLSGGLIQQARDDLGGAPYATVVPIRVAPWVFSVSTAELAYGIDRASREEKADVISMSHGGSPTQAWVDAVNAAYERGTAMFAAESDFYSILPAPFRPSGIILPSSPVYPAGFRRVIGVTGVTADKRSYAQNTISRLLAAPWQIRDWMFRGSYGADLTSTTLLHPNPRPDESQLWLGDLRPQPIAAYSPNVPWLTVREVNGERISDGVDLNGAGTSAATPQVAAAAALWLQRHYKDFTKAQWRSWTKAEAVYFALLMSADRQGRSGPDPYLGAGLLRARVALDYDLRKIRSFRPPKKASLGRSGPPAGSLYFGKAPNDYFDGSRSILALLGLQSWRNTRPGDRANLCQGYSQEDQYSKVWHPPTLRPGENKAISVQRLYYNMLLLRQWHRGANPSKSERARYWHDAGVESTNRAAAENARTSL